MTMPRPLLIGLILILAFTLGWVSNDELRRREMLVKEYSQTSERVTAMTSAPSKSLKGLSQTRQLETQQIPSPVFSSYQSTPTSTAISMKGILVTNEEPPVCSSFDQAGLLATFDASLAAFIADASATYGDQYTNLQYQLADKTGAITGEQGTVTTTYSGTVQELSTGEGVSANGLITANFAWDGCVWQLVDYSF
jgi:hypothetical protein